MDHPFAHEAVERNAQWYQMLLSDEEYFGWLNRVIAAFEIAFPYTASVR